VAEDPPRRIVLVGFMGAGKTTVGATLAARLGWGFLDLDRRIEERAGRSVPEIFRRDGEPAFREEERRAAEEAAGLDRLVIAAGGGAFAHPATRAALARGSMTVWLACSLETVLERIAPGPDRPLASSRERMHRLMSLREPSYRLADRVVDASAEPSEVVRRVLAAVFGTEGGAAPRA
jgi:shikimate kinase